MNNAKTISGLQVDNVGKIANQITDWNRWLEHANRGKNIGGDYYTIGSDGCSITSYENQLNLFKKFQQWNLTNGYQIATTLLNNQYYTR